VLFPVNDVYSATLIDVNSQRVGLPLLLRTRGYRQKTGRELVGVTERAVFDYLVYRPAVCCAEMRELPGRAGPITQFFLFTAILSSV
jgi:hypothetical protein